MIDAHHTEGEADLGPVLVISPTGMLVGIFWGTRFDICEAIDEITDPNECKFRRCGPGGIQLGCFQGEQEISLPVYSQAIESAPEGEHIEVRLEGFSDSAIDWLDTNEVEWLPVVPPGYMYSAGVGLTKTGTDWN